MARTVHIHPKAPPKPAVGSPCRSHGERAGKTKHTMNATSALLQQLDTLTAPLAAAISLPRARLRRWSRRARTPAWRCARCWSAAQTIHRIFNEFEDNARHVPAPHPPFYAPGLAGAAALGGRLGPWRGAGARGRAHRRGQRAVPAAVGHPEPGDGAPRWAGAGHGEQARPVRRTAL